MTRSHSALAIGVDLGSTSIKAGILDSSGRLRGIESVPAPALRGSGGVREGDAEAYVRATRELLDAVSGALPRGTPTGIATQRSSFTLWDRRNGRPRVPMVSWQDRRAAEWCDRHRDIEPEIVRRTGLPLSTHYVGPKLAAMQEHDGDLHRAMRTQPLAFGTLETFLLWRGGSGQPHQTDLSVAARSLLIDLESEDWSAELLSQFRVPHAVLPRVVSTVGRDLPLGPRVRVTATLSDQAAGALAVFDEARSSVLVNLGTGAFVLRETGRAEPRKPGYLLGPLFASADADRRYALEGTINGSGPALERYGPGPTGWPETDPHPEGFSVPDGTGLGSPHWRPDIGLTFSAAAQGLDRPELRRIVLEGVLFRIREILEDLFENDATPQRIVLAGGVLRDPAVGRGLAALLDRPVEQLLERESGLLGASRLAAGLPPCAGSPTAAITPGDGGPGYLREKFLRWNSWFRGVRGD